MRGPKEWIARIRQIAPERFLLIALALVAVGLWIFAVTARPQPVEVIAFAVGKGDALLIREPAGRTVLIDGGSSDIPDVGKRVLVPNLFLHHVRQLDAIIISHPDSDHVNGLAEIIQAVPVKMILDPEIPSESAPYQQVIELAEQQGIPRYRIRAGDRLHLSKRTMLRVLAPGETLLGGVQPDTNNNSVVCMLECRRARMLFTGDLEAEGEQALLAQQLDLRADVLKIAHHGSRNGTSEDFLTAVNPYNAVICCPGGNEHPHADVLARLRAHGTRILRTDVYGQMRLTTDGVEWQVSTVHPGRLP